MGEYWHAVTLAKGFWMSKYEITQSQWEAVMGTTPSSFVGADRPVETVAWVDVHDFLIRLNYLKSQPIYRLPTEAEWEYACRAGESASFYWGDDPNLTEIENYAWYDLNSGNETHPVGEKLPNDWGLYDMGGNVWELCQDWFGGLGEPYSVAPVTDPLGPDSGTRRVARGGGYSYVAEECRSENRGSADPETDTLPELGFRLVRTAD
ncbi:MAG: formylglycine-generating enzyme family protein [Candidatus Hydrogenedentes bacterium]|nr:formylglycine-generating enzyme family protein [Candidatus Hydrogenedentota bacterium]